MTQQKRAFSGSRSSGGVGGTTRNSNQSSGASCSANPLSPDCSDPMKKAKSHPVAACSLDQEKNGLQRRFDTDVPPRPAEEDDAMIVEQEELKSRSPAPATMTGVAANLSRKKATPLQPPTTKKFVIKSFKIKPSLPTNFEEDTWATLKSAITAIFLKRPDPCDCEKLYQAVSNLCLHKMGGSLYQRIEEECEMHISRALSSLVGQSPDLVVFLSLVEKCWQDFCNQMLTIRGIALVLDRTYVMQTPNVCSLWDMGLQLFRKHLTSSQEVEHKVVTGLLRLIEKERQGEAIGRTILSHLLKMLTALGIYTDSFEKPFLQDTSEFYASEGVKYMQQSDVPDYLKHVDLRLHEEHERCLLYLDATTRKPLVATAEKQLLERHTSAILEKGFTMLMEANRIDDLQRMYRLFQKVNALELIKQALSSYIRGTGQAIIMDEEKDKDLVSYLLEFKASLDKILEESFFKNEVFSNTIKDSFEHLINLRQNRPAELIAKFVDEKLRAGNKGTSEEELEGILDKVLVLFRFIQGKDVFEAFYKKDLAKRLLLGKSASIDAEKSMITKLKTECGSQFTNKLEGMFKDIGLSKEINDSFKQSSQARTKLPTGIEMSVHVLTTGYWPTYPPMDIRLPHELNVYQDIFKEFYLSKYHGRRLFCPRACGQLEGGFPSLDFTTPSAIPFCLMASAKVDDRGLGSKRSRSEGFRRDGDWTCSQCGNVNFSFRTACNRGSCGAVRPSASPGPRTGPVSYLGSFDRPLPSYYGGMGIPPPMPLGMSGGYGSPLPPFHGMRYDYGPPSGAPGPYSLMSPYGPSGPLRGYGYVPGPIMDRYGGPIMDRYGYGYRGSPMPVPDSTPGELLDNSASRKRRGGPDGLFEGDWVCPKCENVNFAFRTTCNMKKCGAPRPASAGNRTSGKDKADAPEGSWTCDKCNNLNYPFRNMCNRKGCGSEKPSSSK